MKHIASYIRSLPVVIFGLILSLAVVPSLISSTKTPVFAQSSVIEPTGEQLGKKMAELSASDNPQDIATLAYIWGYPLVIADRTKAFYDSWDCRRC
ncbi:MAG: hypothetical protein WAM14_27380 [Candidatus Nitrosopolaris sp.]